MRRDTEQHHEIELIHDKKSYFGMYMGGDDHASPKEVRKADGKSMEEVKKEE